MNSTTVFSSQLFCVKEWGVRPTFGSVGRYRRLICSRHWHLSCLPHSTVYDHFEKRRMDLSTQVCNHSYSPRQWFIKHTNEWPVFLATCRNSDAGRLYLAWHGPNTLSHGILHVYSPSQCMGCPCLLFFLLTLLVMLKSKTNMWLVPFQRAFPLCILKVVDRKSICVFLDWT